MLLSILILWAKIIGMIVGCVGGVVIIIGGMLQIQNWIESLDSKAKQMWVIGGIVLLVTLIMAICMIVFGSVK